MKNPVTILPSRLLSRLLSRQSERGTVLVPILAFSVLITIAVGGYLSVAVNTVNQDLSELGNDKAFFAAESGLQLGSQWVLKHYQPGNFPSQTDLFGPTLRGANAVNGMDVTVAIIADGPSVTVTSLAENPAKLSYRKLISRKMSMIASDIPSGGFGLYLDNAYQLGGNTKGIRKMDWDGPAHFNTALRLGNPGGGNETHFYDKVTLRNIDPGTNTGISNMSNPVGHFGNDYRYGAEGGSGNWDSEFQATYNPFSERIVADFDISGKTDITVNASDSSVVFGTTSGVPYYQYKNASGTVVKVNYNPATELKLHIVNKGAAVSGSVTGKISVYTDPGKNIYLPGNLTYADFSTTSFSSSNKEENYDYGMTGANILGLFSGGEIVVSEGTHYITAQLFGVNSTTGTITFESDKKNKTKFYLFGTLAVNGFWDVKQGNDQATFQQLWDRRQRSAPGLAFKKVDNAGVPINTISCTYSEWYEVNIP